MKKRIKVLGLIVAAMVLVGIVGVYIYVSVPVKISEHQITLSVSNVTAKGLKLHVKREDPNGNNISYQTWANYTLYEYEAFRWIPVYMDNEYERKLSQEETQLITNSFEYTWNVDWREGCGKLSTGLYRMGKEIGRTNRTETYFVQFIVFNWLEIGIALLVLSALVVGGKLAWKLRATIITHKRLILVMFGLIIIFLGVLWGTKRIEHSKKICDEDVSKVVIRLQHPKRTVKKEADRKEDIERIIRHINKIKKKELDIDEWYGASTLIEVVNEKGMRENSVVFSGYYMKLDEQWYVVALEEEEKLKEIYEKLDYEEIEWTPDDFYPAEEKD